jgi:hypothetical protein
MSKKNPKVNGQRSVAIIFECFMSLVYLIFAYALLTGVFNERFNDTFNSKVRLPLGIVLVIYGLFRIRRAIVKIKAAKSDESD